ncbi:unnamed protein product [Didymodactylos carnosus]|uniref:Uncharacterized protein n=1 Tax=Didymodactylos carnosus TaxID=1234261 RepID=A0A815A2M9_9BILA|nr:unnamed protein product [Didymodactylos carnosus]CAF1387313.1 unnamed protein product [Didymodactylos carnosus]CAF4021111.1 unnamed protein product [Didymodactylos carnosus]CAF4195172.1 unnamed protein product [Didymodactylos carnosus]
MGTGCSHGLKLKQRPRDRVISKQRKRVLEPALVPSTSQFKSNIIKNDIRTLDGPRIQSSLNHNQSSPSSLRRQQNSVISHLVSSYHHDQVAPSDDRIRKPINRTATSNQIDIQITPTQKQLKPSISVQKQQAQHTERSLTTPTTFSNPLYRLSLTKTSGNGKLTSILRTSSSQSTIVQTTTSAGQTKKPPKIPTHVRCEQYARRSDRTMKKSPLEDHMEENLLFGSSERKRPLIDVTKPKLTYLSNSEHHDDSFAKQDKRSSQPCPTCDRQVAKYQLYPRHICDRCVYRARDKPNGRPVEFYNMDSMGYGCHGYYSNTDQKEVYDSTICYIKGNKKGQEEKDKTWIRCQAQEARFGGIVIQPN